MTLDDELQIARAITSAARCSLQRAQQDVAEFKAEVDKLQSQWAIAKKLEESIEQKLIERNLNVSKM